MDQYQNFFSNPLFYPQHPSNPAFFNNPSLCNLQQIQDQFNQQPVNYTNHPEDPSQQQGSSFINQFVEFATNPNEEQDERIPKKKRRKRSDKVSTTKWPNAEATIIREQVADESEVVREQVLIPETADPSKLVLQKLGPKCANPFLCRKLKRQCKFFVHPLREHILKTFKIDLNEGERRIFILNNVEAVPTRKSNVFKLIYFLKDHRYNKRLQVCRTMFLNTLSITSDELKAILRSSQCGMIPSVHFILPKVEKKPNPNLNFSNAEYGDHAISDDSDDGGNPFDDFKEEPELNIDSDDYDPLDKDAVPKEMPGSRKKKNIEDIIKSGGVSKVSRPEQMGPRCSSKRCKSCDNFNDERRDLLFSSFWNMMSWRERKDFVIKTVICRKPNKTIYADGKSPRQFTYDYSLPLSYNLKDYTDPNVQLIPVCSIMYINTLGLKINVVKRFVKQGPDDFDEIEVDKIIQDPKYLLEAQIQTKNKRRINWKAVQRELRGKGETYYTQVKENDEIKYVQRDPKKMRARCSGKRCKIMSTRQCLEITESQREEIFRHYWKDLDKQQKKLFICENVFEDTTGRMKDIAEMCKKKGKFIELKTTRREITYRYHFPVNGKKLQVCKAMFVGTLSLPDKTVGDVIKGAYGLLNDSGYKATLLNISEEAGISEPMIKVKDEVVSDNDPSDDESESASQTNASFCDDKSSSESDDSETEEVLPRKVRKAAMESSSNHDDSEDYTVVPKTSKRERPAWYRKKNKFLKKRCTGCRRKCKEILDSHREAIFKHFWNDLDSNGRDAFVRSFITVEKSLRSKMLEEAFKDGGSYLDDADLPRNRCTYYLPKGLDGEKVNVCGNMFEGTLAIGSYTIKRIRKG